MNHSPMFSPSPPGRYQYDLNFESIKFKVVVGIHYTYMLTMHNFKYILAWRKGSALENILTLFLNIDGYELEKEIGGGEKVNPPLLILLL